ncbi:MAG: DUF3999 domain-containing protein [Proteobacteria bacterium]|nr:DUF3999 domain-containing protein [Pseudomonadota bacterium]
MKNIFAISAMLITSLAALANSKGYQKQMQLELSGNSSGYSFAVPEEVYIHSFYKDLRDVRIINGTGDFVPMRLFLTADEVKNEYTKSSLPVFKLNQTISIPSSSKQIRTTREGTHEDFTVTTSKSLQHYLKTQEIVNDNQILIDAGALNGQRIESLELDWHYQSKGNRIFYVDVLGSNDLSRWVNIKNRHQLVEIHTGSKTLLENTLTLNNKTYSYYKLNFIDGVIPEVTRVQAHFFNQTIKSNMQSKEISKYSLIKDNALQFDSGGKYSIESFKLSFSQNNTITDVHLYSRSNVHKKWQHVGAGTLYSITSDGVQVKQDTVKIRRSNNRSNNRFWKIQFDLINNKLVDKIEINWRSHQIQFLAQGEAPFTMVYSNSENPARASGSWYKKIPQTLRKKMFSSQAIVPEINSPSETNVKSANNQTNDNIDYEKWIFWLILGSVLLVLFLMAYKLTQDIDEN